MRGYQDGEKHPRWNGGVKQTSSGYTALLRPGHPRALRSYVYEHLLIAEAVLGYYLPPGVEVHHHNECKADNAHRNLVICENQAYHRLLHARKRAYLACGIAAARQCCFCKEWGTDIIAGRFRHRACHNAHAKQYRQEKRAQC